MVRHYPATYAKDPIVFSYQRSGKDKAEGKEAVYASTNALQWRQWNLQLKLQDREKVSTELLFTTGVGEMGQNLVTSKTGGPNPITPSGEWQSSVTWFGATVELARN